MVVIVACGLWLGYYAVDSQHQKQTYETLAEDFLLKEPAPTVTTREEEIVGLGETLISSDNSASFATTPPRHDLAALQAENPDCVGWLTFPDTTVDYPVVWTPSDPEHYLRRDFYGNSASGGTPFLDRRNQRRQRDRTLLYTATICWTAPCSSPLYSVWSQVSDKHTGIFTWN